MSFCIFLFIMVAFLMFCIVIMRNQTSLTFTELKDSFVKISDHYHGVINDTECLKNISVEFKHNKSNVVVKTIVTGRTKYTNTYSILISKTDNKNRVIKKKLKIEDALDNKKLLATISSMLDT